MVFPRGKKVFFLRLASALVLPFLLLAALNLFAGWYVRGRLSGYDAEASFRGLEYGMGTLLIRGLSMPGAGFSAKRACLFLSGGLLHPRVDRVLLDGVTFSGFSHGGSAHSQASWEEPPAVLVTDGAVPRYGTFFCGSKQNGTETGCFNGEWGEIIATRRGDSVAVVFTDCTEFPVVPGAIPEQLRGHSVSGWFRGVLNPGTSFTGVVTELDGSPVRVLFDYHLSDDGPSAAIKVDFGQIEQAVFAVVDSLSGGSVLYMAPAGSLSVFFSGGDSVFFTADITIDSLSVWNPALAADTFSFRTACSLSGSFLPAAGSAVIDSGTIELEDLDVDFSLACSWKDRRRLSLSFPRQTLPGGAIVSSVPPAFMGTLRGLELGGELSFGMSLVLDWDDPDSCDISIDIDPSALRVGYSPIRFGKIRDCTGATCRMTDSWGNTVEIGLDSTNNPGFVQFDSLPFSFEPLLRCAEDASFRRHHGFSLYHIRNSIIADMQHGRFVRGGSTLTMQLVKNLFLGREKTFARKLQEVFLTWRTERWLSKDRILEIYANIVELGPRIFGFNAAASYYFNKSADSLSVRETAFLVSILPGPRLYHRFAVSGRLPAYWNSYIDRLITISGRRGWLEDSVVRAALADTIIFRGAVSLPQVGTGVPSARRRYNSYLSERAERGGG